MQAEIIDLCHNYHSVVSGYSDEKQAQLSEIRNYYMSDALVSLPGTNNVHEILDKAVFEDKKDGAAYTASMTKALFKDGSIDNALSFFESQIQKRREVKEDQEEHLVNLFDSTFGQEDQPSLDAFKQKYLSLMQVREQSHKEVQVINSLQEILNRCDDKQIENVFLFQICLKEEKELIMQITKASDRGYKDIFDQVSERKDR